jgi:hypothetical protein
MPAMDYSKVADLYDLYVQTEVDVPFFLQEAQGCQSVLELTSGTGRLSLPDDQGMLYISSWEKHDAATHMVSGMQLYELLNRNGSVQSKRYLKILFYLHSRDSFESLAKAQGYHVVALYGDYERTAFQPQTSSFMIWILSKQ